MNVHITRWVSVAGLASVVLALVAGAHDNNTVHHLITKEAGEALRMSDQVGGEGAGGAYAELYAGFGSSTGQKYWGDGVMLTQSEAETDAAAGFAAFRRVPLNVIDGSVLEDQPVRRVFSHFHHGYNAKTMDPSGVLPDSATLDRSPIDAFRYFDQAIEVFDYAEDGAITQASTGAVARADSGKSLAFWLLGHALHLVEDLSSPAHVQNDAHLTVDFWHLPSDDAFEGQYLPTLMWAAAENSNQARKVSAQALLEGMRSSIPINVASFEGIWPQPHVGSMELSASKKLFANSLARGTYNLSVYHAWLQVPGWLPVNPSPCPTGELAEMLNGPGSSCGPDSVLYRDDFSRQWMIEGVGGYSYSPGSHAYDSWWPVSPPYQPMAAYQGPHVLPEQGPGSYYYLEDLNDGERFGNGSDPMIDAKLLTPVGVRRNFELPWNPAASSNLPANPVVPNTKPLVQLMAEHILPQGAAHVAGFAQYWYDIANPPPYLKRVVVHQGDVVCYEASWKDVMASRSIVLANKDPCQRLNRTTHRGISSLNSAMFRAASLSLPPLRSL